MAVRGRLFHIVTPDPEEYSPVTNIETEESYYFLKLGRGRDYDDYQEARRHNLVISIVFGDIPQAEEEEEENEGKPGKFAIHISCTHTMT